MVLGVAAPVDPGSPLTEEAAAIALSFSFPTVEQEWEDPTGSASHGWLFRRAYIAGYGSSTPPTHYSEQVLKVGWPFTVVRGFIRNVEGRISREGAPWTEAQAPEGAARLLPTQPVWLGLALYGLLGTIVASGVGRIRGRHDPRAFSA
jgi:hypothetical protein